MTETNSKGGVLIVTPAPDEPWGDVLEARWFVDGLLVEEFTGIETAAEVYDIAEARGARVDWSAVDGE